MLKNINFCLSIAMIFPSLILTLSNTDRSLAMASYGLCIVFSLGLLLLQGKNWTFLQASCCIYYVVTFFLTALVPLADIFLINKWSLWIVYIVLSGACFLPKYVGAKTFVEQYSRREFPGGQPPLVVRLNLIWGLTFLILLAAAIVLPNPFRATLSLAIVCLSVFITKKMRKKHTHGN